jgi:hypothetical protein
MFELRWGLPNMRSRRETRPDADAELAQVGRGGAGHDALERWEEKSGGKALFLWAVKKDEQGRSVHRQLRDKLGNS